MVYLLELVEALIDVPLARGVAPKQVPLVRLRVRELISF